MRHENPLPDEYGCGSRPGIVPARAHALSAILDTVLKAITLTSSALSTIYRTWTNMRSRRKEKSPMPYTVPTLPLIANVRRGNAPLSQPPDLVTPCQLRIVKTSFAISFGTQFTQVLLLVPKGTDLRDASGATGQDGVECPAGSGRTYLIYNVDDIAKGFENEHRVALMRKTAPWPTPIP